MSNKDNRLIQLEQKTSAKHIFIDWGPPPMTEEEKAEAIRNNPAVRAELERKPRTWTEEEKAEEIRKHPEGGVFWMPLLKAYSYVIDEHANHAE